MVYIKGTTREIDNYTKQLAIINFVSRVGRLPCPADGAVSAGLEVRTAAGACSAQSSGVVPWLSVGLAEADIIDGWSSRITYRVAAELVLDDAMNLSACDPAGTAAASGAQPSQSCRASCNKANNCTPDSAVLIGKGLTIRNAAGVVQANPAASTGAGFVLISQGENRHGGCSNNVLQTGASSPGAAELVNANNQPLAAAYISDDFKDEWGTCHIRHHQKATCSSDRDCPSGLHCERRSTNHEWQCVKKR